MFSIQNAIFLHGVGAFFFNQGKDDLRQDAVMQQVFGMVNQLLKENSETKKRDLRIKTYKVLIYLSD